MRLSRGHRIVGGVLKRTLREQHGRYNHGRWGGNVVTNSLFEFLKRGNQIDKDDRQLAISEIRERVDATLSASMVNDSDTLGLLRGIRVLLRTLTLATMSDYDVFRRVRWAAGSIGAAIDKHIGGE